ncbi:MAG TPA: hypothetical protein PLU66_02215 [Trueperaceae bacterium]|nr:hypothetical protein [Trueperaceae bacterium]
MDLQGRILISYGVLALGVISIFITVAVKSRGPAQTQATVQVRGYAIRRWWFWILTASLLTAFAVSIPFFPYGGAQAAGEATHFPVIARQYTFGNLPQSVPLGQPVVFDVTAADVTHGFAIYDPQDRIVGQVQAMPGYVNELPMTFTEPGDYTVRCLEYCGLGHPLMQGSFEVR